MRYASSRQVRWERWIQHVAFIMFTGVAAAALAGWLGDRSRIVANSAAIYLLLLLIFRVAGRRTLSEATTFDLVLLLIIGETTQQAMIGDDRTVAGAGVAIVSLVAMDMAISRFKEWSPAFDRLLEGEPILLIKDGAVCEEALHANSLDQGDLEEAARLTRGLAGLAWVRQATLERDGKISIIPVDGPRP